MRDSAPIPSSGKEMFAGRVSTIVCHAAAYMTTLSTIYSYVKRIAWRSINSNDEQHPFWCINLHLYKNYSSTFVFLRKFLLTAKRRWYSCRHDDIKTSQVKRIPTNLTEPSVNICTHGHMNPYRISMKLTSIWIWHPVHAWSCMLTVWDQNFSLSVINRTLQKEIHGASPHSFTSMRSQLIL